ncbi:MAG TPA: hypothetical protein VGG29_00260 [Caulobacteraceae bacterium]|jgi:hypothetical protein
MKQHIDTAAATKALMWREPEDPPARAEVNGRAYTADSAGEIEVDLYDVEPLKAGGWRRLIVDSDGESIRAGGDPLFWT